MWADTDLNRQRKEYILIKGSEIFDRRFFETVKNSKAMTACGSELKAFLLPTEEQSQVITGCHGDKKLERSENSI